MIGQVNNQQQKNLQEGKRFNHLKKKKIERATHPKLKENILLSTHETFTKTDHILGHRETLNIFQRIDITQTRSSNHMQLR